jgi:SpoVK/Ycf46/Vps4 family AAA+-type ATPase
MWLKASFEEYVENDDIIVSSSLFGYMCSLLSLSSSRIGSISISCEVAEILTEVPVAECSELVIRPLRLYRTGHLLEQPASWSSTTPTLPVLVQSLIGKHFRDLCNSNVFSPGSHILLPFLNSVVAFEIVSSTTSHSVFFISSESHIKVETIFQPANSDNAEIDGMNNALPKSEELSSLYRPLIFKEYYFLSEAVNRAMFIIHSLAHNNEYCSNNSVLFQGPKGVGKSFLMKALVQYCHINLPLFEVTSNTLVEVVCIDCQEIIQKNIRPSLSVVQSEVTLDEIIGALKAMVVTHQPSQSVASKIVLFVDHLDEILGLFAEESMQDRAALSNASLNNTRHYLAFLLHHLLMQLRVNRSSTKSYISIIVIGATRLSTQLLPRANLGSPEFQLIVQIPKPTRQDREQLWLHMLDNYCQLCSNDFVFKAGSSKSSLVLCGFPATDTSMSERDQWAKALTGASRGYLPGDLMGILETAANISYKKQKQSQDRGLDYPDCRELQLDWNSMLQALAEVPPASVLDLSLELLPDLAPTLTWDHFVGYENAKQQVQRIAKMIQYKSPLSASSSSTKSLLGKKRSIGMVVHGVSGCGKSLLVQTMAKETKMNFVSITGGTLLSKYFGDTEARIRSIFQRARNAAPCILYFDNFDALAHRRGSEDSSTTSSGNIGNRILSTFLNELDGIGSELAVKEGTTGKPGSREGDEQIVFVVVSCSDVQQLDEALVRPG